MTTDVGPQFTINAAHPEIENAKIFEDILESAKVILDKTGRRPNITTGPEWKSLDRSFKKGKLGTQYESLTDFFIKNNVPRIVFMLPTPTIMLEDLIESIDATFAAGKSSIQFLTGYFQYGPLAKDKMTGHMVSRAIKAETVIGLEPGLYKDLKDLCEKKGYKRIHGPRNPGKESAAQLGAPDSNIPTLNPYKDLEQDINDIRTLVYARSLAPITLS